jgi:hypothetical protein
MKKFKSFIIPVACILLFSCNNELGISKNQDEISVENGMLVFANEQVFLTALRNVENGTIVLENGKIPNLDYRSFFGKRNIDSNSSAEINNLLDIRGFQVLLNENRDFKIGKRIIHIDSCATKVFSEVDGSHEIYENEVNVLDRDSKMYFKKGSKGANARGLNERKTYDIGNNTDRISDIFTSVSSRFLWNVKYLYYYDARIVTTNYVSFPSKVYYWKFDGGGVQLENVNYNIPIYTYDKQSIRYYLGDASSGYASSPGAGYYLYMKVQVKSPSEFGNILFSYSSQFYQ